MSGTAACFYSFRATPFAATSTTDPAFFHLFQFSICPPLYVDTKLSIHAWSLSPPALPIRKIEWKPYSHQPYFFPCFVFTFSVAKKVWNRYRCVYAVDGVTRERFLVPATLGKWASRSPIRRYLGAAALYHQVVAGTRLVSPWVIFLNVAHIRQF